VRQDLKDQIKHLTYLEFTKNNMRYIKYFIQDYQDLITEDFYNINIKTINNFRDIYWILTLHNNLQILVRPETIRHPLYLRDSVDKLINIIKHFCNAPNLTKKNNRLSENNKCRINQVDFRINNHILVN
jgi:hypothetical protein